MKAVLDNPPVPPRAGPLTQTAGRLGVLIGNLDYRVGAIPEAGWSGGSDLADSRLLAEWHADLNTKLDDRRVAGSYMSNWLLGVLTGTWTLPSLAAGRLPLAGLDEVAVRRNAEGWFDGVAVASESVGALPGDTALAYPGSISFTDREEMFDELARRLGELAPVVDALRGACPVGMNALWGMVADGVASQALQIARLTGGDHAAAWRDAEQVIERLALLQPRLRPRPRAFPVAAGTCVELFDVRGTCCLYYRTVENPDRDGEGYCDNCPLRTDESRLTRLRASFE